MSESDRFMPSSLPTFASSAGVGIFTLAMVVSPSVVGKSVRAHADELRDQVVVMQMVGRDLAGDAALLDDQDAVRQAADEFEILLDQHDGEAALLPEAAAGSR